VEYYLSCDPIKRWLKKRKTCSFFYSDEKEPELLDERQYKKKNESCTGPATPRGLGQINEMEYQNYLT